MSATDKTTTDFGFGAVAYVNFRVRCEGFGYGEEIFLVAKDATSGHEKVRDMLLRRKKESLVPLEIMSMNRGKNWVLP